MMMMMLMMLLMAHLGISETAATPYGTSVLAVKVER